MSGSEYILEVENLVHVYGEGRTTARAVDGVSFSIRKGETFGLVGESGCGKTTTGRMIVKLLDITSGVVCYDGRDITKLQSKQELMRFRREVQIIFQDPYASLDPRKKVKDIIAEGIDAHKLADSNRRRDELVEGLLSAVQLDKSFASRYPHEFSGGQRQRVGIARALALKPRFIVCDEPISALDVSIQAQVVNLLKELQQAQNLTYLFIAHDLSMVRYISDRIGVMYKGRLVETGPADEVYFHPIHPYTKSLLSAIPLPDPEFERERRRIAYAPNNNQGPFALRELMPEHYVFCDAAGNFQ
ncbi:MAG TPA: ATP-binding cassette domain-containing protein [Clostridia bacterium]|nr:ATP-binding cassette domain-containing protein [Clostridia bacterium]